MTQALTIYALRDHVDDFDDAITEEALDNPAIETHDLVGDFPFEARLYNLPVPPTPPNWTEFLQLGFPAFTPTPSAMNRVAVILRIADPRRLFALTFGSGRFLLRPDAYAPKYGLRVALNTIYEGDADALVPSDRLRQVSLTTVGKNTMHTRRQTNRNAAFQDFQADLSRDLLNAVVGVPTDAAAWGTRVSGSDAIHLHAITGFDQLGQLCHDLHSAYAETSYQVRFKAIDNVKEIPRAEQGPLEELAIDQLATDPDAVALAPPSIVSWDDISAFRYSLDRSRDYQDLNYSDYLELLDDPPTLDDLRRHRIEALGPDGDVLESWPVFAALDLEISRSEGVILLTGGLFYSIAPDYLSQLNADLDTMEEASYVLPLSTISSEGNEETEGDYNARAAAEDPDLALLDKNTVRLPNTDPIEVCDLLTTTGLFIHVKRKFSSSSLSHLFAQGSVSGNLFLSNSDFRSELRAKLDPRFHSLVPPHRPDAALFEVVYAIIGRWDGAALTARLPFFSKVNLRHHADLLRTLGYRVTYKPVDLRQPPA